ncbi:hypothetical protein Y032_0011g1470 [Ancylostoma ceylanicum]|uniref:Uncharacterized protein n=1 Tax=Ancylostoma ceylanicum TaxID=53326 RepID=A0A016VEU2_9BILA|nr:hypothetical protein Y032_0011g1470 [Ancylostoma ceylanicum]
MGDCRRSKSMKPTLSGYLGQAGQKQIKKAQKTEKMGRTAYAPQGSARSKTFHRLRTRTINKRANFDDHANLNGTLAIQSNFN